MWIGEAIEAEADAQQRAQREGGRERESESEMMSDFAHGLRRCGVLSLISSRSSPRRRPTPKSRLRTRCPRPHPRLPALADTARAPALAHIRARNLAERSRSYPPEWRSDIV
eukprot:798017-Pleurochrysis_carterae.AAC.1